MNKIHIGGYVTNFSRGFMAATLNGHQIGDRIRDARIEARLTQSELGDHVGLSQGMINKLETGQSALTLENLFKIAKALDRPVVHFLGIGTGQLTADEAELVEIYRSLSEGLPRRWALIMLREWAREMESGWPEFRNRHGF
jgi:transcriptional regulator with XRE-family HTH domain